jgi:hypothetical protein
MANVKVLHLQSNENERIEANNINHKYFNKAQFEWHGDLREEIENNSLDDFFAIDDEEAARILSGIEVNSNRNENILDEEIRRVVEDEENEVQENEGENDENEVEENEGENDEGSEEDVIQPRYTGRGRGGTRKLPRNSRNVVNNNHNNNNHNNNNNNNNNNKNDNNNPNGRGRRGIMIIIL